VSEKKYQIPSKIPIDGDKIKKRREELGLTQLYVASIVGVTTDTISRWENKKYPTIKRENALKLAKALEIDIIELIKEEKKQNNKEINEPKTINHNVANEDIGKIDNNNLKAKKSKLTITKNIITYVFLILLLTICVSFFVYYRRYHATHEVINVKRILPHYVAPGEKFPVIIDINIKGNSISSLILREHFPDSCTFIKSIPKATMKNIKKKELDWIFPANKNKIVVIYFLKTKKETPINKYLKFTGNITIKQGRYKQPIISNTILTIKYIHWADINGDLKIDDQEILTIFDELQGIKGSEYGKKKIEELWAAGSYHWDSKTHKFIPNNGK